MGDSGREHRCGMTLIEVLAVVAIMALVMMVVASGPLGQVGSTLR